MRNLRSSGSRFVYDTVGIEARRFCVRLGAQSPNRIRAKSVCVRLAMVVYYFRAYKIQAVHGWRPSFRASTVQRSSHVRLPAVCFNLGSHFTADVRLLTKNLNFKGIYARHRTAADRRISISPVSVMDPAKNGAMAP